MTTPRVTGRQGRTRKEARTWGIALPIVLRRAGDRRRSASRPESRRDSEESQWATGEDCLDAGGATGVPRDRQGSGRATGRNELPTPFLVHASMVKSPRTHHADPAASRRCGADQEVRAEQGKNPEQLLRQGKHSTGSRQPRRQPSSIKAERSWLAHHHTTHDTPLPRGVTPKSRGNQARANRAPTHGVSGTSYHSWYSIVT